MESKALGQWERARKWRRHVKGLEAAGDGKSSCASGFCRLRSLAPIALLLCSLLSFLLSILLAVDTRKMSRFCIPRERKAKKRRPWCLAKPRPNREPSRGEREGDAVFRSPSTTTTTSSFSSFPFFSLTSVSSLSSSSSLSLFLSPSTDKTEKRNREAANPLFLLS